MTIADRLGLEDVENEIVDRCTTCPRLCRFSCPVAEAESKETSSPWNLVVLGGLLKRGLASPDEVGDFAYHCSHCGACTDACLHKNDVRMAVSFTRSRALSTHVAPGGANEVRGHFGTAGNPYGTSMEESLTQVLTIAEATGNENLAKASGAIVYFPGCATLHERPQAAVGFLRALAVQGITGVAVTEASASCCGLPLLWAGDLEGFKAHAERHRQRVDSADILVAHDPACAVAMRQWYSKLSVPIAPEVVHVSAFVRARLGIEIDERHEKPRKDTPVYAYMDSCNLARGLDVIEDPRALIRMATRRPAKELPAETGRFSDCCGAGGLLPDTCPSTATHMAEERIQLFRKTGAEQLVTSSPRCAAHLAKADPTIEVIDLMTLLAKL